jgi:hypothetical protein
MYGISLGHDTGGQPIPSSCIAIWEFKGVSRSSADCTKGSNEMEEGSWIGNIGSGSTESFDVGLPYPDRLILKRQAL